MKLMCSKKRLIRLVFPFLLVVCLFSIGITAQTKKAPAAKKTVSKKTVSKKNEKKATVAKKDSRRDLKKTAAASKDSKKSRSSAKDKETAKRKDSKSSKRDKLTAKEQAREKDSKKDKNSKKKESAKKSAESRAERAARRRAEEERRQAALAERRRREQIAREARERKLAFERGLRTETVTNIENDSTEGEDLKVRHAAVNALGSHAGTIVVMEAQTGKVVTIVNQDWAIRNSFKPCSTIKLVTGVGGINEHVINEDGGIGESTSGMKLDYALARSNNGYFQRVGSKMGSSKMIGYAKSLGLGEPTGINAEGETAGRLPYGNNNARIYSHGDDFEVSPLQLAVMVSAISNGGRKVVPQIPGVRKEKTAFTPQLSEQVNVPQRNVEGVIPGMIGAAEYGTARRGVDASMGVAGKTGSCIAKGSWVGLFASVAPVEDPKYSVVVITRGQSERGKYAAAIAGKVYEALRSRVVRNPNSDLAKRLARPGTPPVTTVAADDLVAGEEETDGDEANADAEAPIIVGRPSIPVAPQPAVKKLVQKTVQSKPVGFPPVVITFDKSGAEKDETVKSGAVKTRPRIVKN